jgi:hypothetical protein
MDYEKEIDSILKNNLSTIAYNFWRAANQKIPNIFGRPSSSTGKYHNDENGKTKTVGEHTYEMLQACIGIWRMFDVKSKTEEGDILLLSIIFHDAFKYGKNPESRNYTDNSHDKLCADLIQKGKNTFLKFMNEDSVSVLEECIRFHSGRWSTNAQKNFDFRKLHPFTFFVHTLDMLSANNLIKQRSNISK